MMHDQPLGTMYVKITRQEWVTRSDGSVGLSSRLRWDFAAVTVPLASREDSMLLATAFSDLAFVEDVRAVPFGAAGILTEAWIWTTTGDDEDRDQEDAGEDEIIDERNLLCAMADEEDLRRDRDLRVTLELIKVWSIWQQKLKRNIALLGSIKANKNRLCSKGLRRDLRKF